MLSWQQTAKEIENLEKDMKSVADALALGGTLAAVNIIGDVKDIMIEIKSEGKRTQALLDQYGGPEKLSENPDALQDFIGEMFALFSQHSL